MTGDAGTNYNNFRRNVQSSYFGISVRQPAGTINSTTITDLGVRYSRGQLHESGRSETFVDDSYLYKTDVHNAVADYNWTISPRLLYTGRIGLDLAIAPGKTSYPDLTSVGFPSYLASNGLTRMPTMEFDQTYTQPVRPMLCRHELQPHVCSRTRRRCLGERLALHQIRRRAAPLLQQFLAAGQSHRPVQLRARRDQSAAGQRRGHSGRFLRQSAAGLGRQRNGSTEDQAASGRQIQRDRRFTSRTTGR